jgi:ferredoxin
MAKRRLVLLVDPIACDGHGVCAELFPEGITADPWGYPILARGPVPTELEAHAWRAVSGCPRMALQMMRERPTSRTR